MHFVGIDLAWGERRPTGLAVLDDDGRLVHVSRGADRRRDRRPRWRRTSRATAWSPIDAPLIVTNPTGNRPAEAALNKDFARFDAGAHPANTGKPEFARAAPRCADGARLGLDINPRSGRARRAIEVYPHPATVALFRLGRTLKYKNKPGPRPRAAARRAARADRAARGPGHRRPALHVDGPGRAGAGLAQAAQRRRDGHPQERAACRRGPGRRRRLRLRRAVRRAPAEADHDVRRLRDRLHRDADPARRPRAAPARPADPAEGATPCGYAATPSCTPRLGWPPTSSSRW